MKDVAALRNAGLLASKAFSPKAIHIRIYPTPIDIAERKGVLNVLRGYGEIDTFRNMKWEYRNPADNTCLAIFRDGKAAQRLVSDSPLRFTLEPVEKEKSQEPSNPYLDLFNKLEAQSKAGQGAGHGRGIASPWLIENGPAADSAADKETPMHKDEYRSQEDGEDTARSSSRQRSFLVHASPWTSNLNVIIDRAPYTGSYAIDKKSLSYQDLAERVPMPGLSVVNFSAKPLPARVEVKRRAALANRKTLRQIKEQKGERQTEDELDGAEGNDAVDVAAMSTIVADGRGGYIDREEAGRRAAGIFTGAKDDSTESMMLGASEDLDTLDHLPPKEQPAIRGTKDGYERARRRNPSPWSRKYDRMI